MKFLELRIPPLLFTAATGVLIWLVARAVPAWRVELTLQGEVAVAVMIAGVAIATAGVVSFRRARTTVNPLRPDAASALVVSGVFRFTRNPMYLGALVCLLGWCIWLGSVPALIILPLFGGYIDRYQIRPEETVLRARFGAEFESYCARVRRWI